MNMNTYIQKDIPGFYIESEGIDSSLCAYTYPDFLDGKYIQLSEDRVNYHNDHPEADIETVLNVAIYVDGKVTWHIAPAEITIDTIKEAKIAELTEYDNSDAVNDFIVNDTIHAWFTPEERSNYKSSVESAKLLGVDELSLYIGENLFTIPTQQAELMLAQIQLYADNCFMVTKTHKINIENLDTVEAVQNYDFTQGYPEKINFTLTLA